MKMKQSEKCVQLVLIHKIPMPEAGPTAYKLDDEIIEHSFGENGDFLEEDVDFLINNLLSQNCVKILKTYEAELIIWNGNEGRSRKIGAWGDKRLKNEWEYEKERRFT